MNKAIDLSQWSAQFVSINNSDTHLLYETATNLLTASFFDQADVEQKIKILISIALKLAPLRSSSYRPIAILGINQFINSLENDQIPFQQGMELYNALYSLLWSSANDITSLEPFSELSKYFQPWIKNHLNINSKNSTKTPNFSKKLNIAYLLHAAEYSLTNAIPPLIVSLTEKHNELKNRKIFLYLIHHPGKQEFIEDISNRNFTVRPFFQPKYDRLDEIARSMQHDEIDVVIADQNRAVATALFIQRVAPIQIFLDLGFPYWNIDNIDWTLSPNLIGGKSGQRSPFTCTQSLRSLRTQSDHAESEKIRALFPEGAFILGIFTRLIKITASFLKLIEKILSENSKIFLIIVGGGSPDPINQYISQSNHKDKIIFLNRNVNLAIYGQAIDVMCDTFPFVGGVACREVGAQGTPVVSMLGTPWDPLLQAERSPDLLAQSEEEYVQIISRLLNDVDFFKRQCQIAHDLVALHTDVSHTVQQIESAMESAITLKTASHP